MVVRLDVLDIGHLVFTADQNQVGICGDQTDEQYDE
jgi:hypothetical protein